LPQERVRKRPGGSSEPKGRVSASVSQLFFDKNLRQSKNGKQVMQDKAIAACSERDPQEWGPVLQCDKRRRRLRGHDKRDVFARRSRSNEEKFKQRE